MLDNAVLEVMVRSVALAAFVEPPRDSAVVPAVPSQSPRKGSSLLARLKTLGNRLAKAIPRRQAGRVREPSPNDCLAA